jgi:hypothetical protein
MSIRRVACSLLSSAHNLLDEKYKEKVKEQEQTSKQEKE